MKSLAALSIAMVASAPILALQGLANAGMSSSITNGWSGYTIERAAMARLQVNTPQGELPVFNMDATGARLGLAAFRSEPLATDGLAIVALDALARDDENRARRIVDIVARMEKRNRTIAMLQLQFAAADGDLASAFDIIDRLVRLRPEAGPQVAGLLVPYLENDETYQTVALALQADPGWASPFWIAAARSRNPRPVLRLRDELGVELPSAVDGMIISSLVSQGFIAEAFELWEERIGASAISTGFVTNSEYAPIGWQFQSTGARSITELEDGNLSIIIQREQSGEIARQLVRLDPGSYSFSAKLNPSGSEEAIRIALLCADDQSEVEWLTIPMDKPWIIGASCRYFWFSLGVDTWTQERPTRAVIYDMALIKQ